MKQCHEVVTPVPKLLSQPQICSDTKLGSDEKVSQGEDRFLSQETLKLLGSSLTGSFTKRRNSAFSIYEPTLDFDDALAHHGSSNESLSSEYNGPNPKRTWKRQKKDKRQMSRLETKNLNRYFRSKINQMLRDIKENSAEQEEHQKADQVLDILNKSNKIMFSEIREIIKDSWLQAKLNQCSGILLKYIHGGKMGMQSKLIMLKYFNKILKAIKNPNNFTCWK